MSVIRTQEALRKMYDHGCVNATMALQAINELEKYDRRAAKRILKYAHEHIERHKKEHGEECR